MLPNNDPMSWLLDPNRALTSAPPADPPDEAVPIPVATAGPPVDWALAIPVPVAGPPVD